MGCGRVGASLARSIQRSGNDVAVIDLEESAFRRLGTAFAGRTVTGVGFDRDNLVAAGIEGAYGFAAVSSGDNSNILAARVARETFGVENVVARIYDPKRAQIYERLGITTVASVAWTAARVTRKLLPEALQPSWTDPSATFVLVERVVPAEGAGKSVGDIQAAVGGKIVLISRNGAQRIGERATLLQEGDRVHVMIAEADTGTLAAMFHNEEGGH